MAITDAFLDAHSNVDLSLGVSADSNFVYCLGFGSSTVSLLNITTGFLVRTLTLKGTITSHHITSHHIASHCIMIASLSPSFSSPHLIFSPCPAMLPPLFPLLAHHVLSGTTVGSSYGGLAVVLGKLYLGYGRTISRFNLTGGDFEASYGTTVDVLNTVLFLLSRFLCMSLCLSI
jgi:hypothetical protein